MKKQLNGNFLFYSCCYFNIFLISYEKALQIDSNFKMLGMAKEMH